MTRYSVLVLCHDPYYNHDTTLVVLQRNLDELDSITKFNDFLDLINATLGFTFVVECKGAPVSEIIKAMDEKNIDYDN
ncbi:MAG: hypothetical protein J1E99_00035 [Muribaculaceae bacterium]|nr:hypothetical protein [Muribaculaceae bacterium]